MVLRKHLSDELLVEHLDGELSLRADSRVKRHLRSCWQCRTRLAELEEQVHIVSQALRAQSFPGPSRIDAARRRFFRRYEELPEQLLASGTQAQLQRAFRSRAPQERYWRWVAVFAVCALVGLVGPALWFYWQSARSATHVLAAATKVESALYQTPLLVHQAFNVEVANIEPREPVRTSRLEIWSDARARRFACRWTNQTGVLKYGSWRSGEGREYVYEPDGPASDSGPILSLTQLHQYGLNPTEIERGFMSWLRSREWHPIALTSDLYKFSSEDGVELRVSPGRFADGAPTLRIAGMRSTDRLTVSFVMEVDAKSYKPRLQVIRIEGHGRTVEFRLIAARVESLSPEQVVPAVFAPPLATGRRTLTAVRQRQVPAPKQVIAGQSLRSAAPSNEELAVVEIEALYVLHRSRACLGEPIEVIREPSSSICVRGLAETAERKRELLVALSEFAAMPFVVIDIRTVAEASGDHVALALRNGVSREEGVSRIVGSASPIHHYLEHYFTQHPWSMSEPGSPKSLSERIASFATSAVFGSRVAYMEAWALRRLAERYAGRTYYSRPQSKWLIEVMMRDHLTALQTQIAAVRARLEPVLLSSKVTEAATPRPAARHPEATLREGDWVAACLALFEKVERTDRLIATLFGGASLPGGAIANARVDDAAQAVVLDLLVALPAAARGVEDLQAQLAGEFSGKPRFASK